MVLGSIPFFSQLYVPSQLTPQRASSTSMEANITNVTFSERVDAADVDGNAKRNTELQMAELYAHVQSMPDGPKKDKLVKQVD